MIGYPQSRLQWDIVRIAAFLTQRKIKYTADNSLSIREAQIIPNNKPKKKSYRKDIQFYMIFGTHVKIYR